MRLDVISIFPDYLAPLELSLIGKARRDGILDLRVHDLRDFTTDRHRSVDDTPYGGGAGMVMKPEPWAQALESVLAPEQAARPTLIVPSPAGEVFSQALAYQLAEEEHLVFACGRYEGIDERVLEWSADRFTVLPVSLGDYVLNGGEVAVLAMVEAIGRLLPGVVGNPESLVEESHADGLLEYPVYTKPSSWRGRDIPEVLISGNHARIARFRRDEQLRRTVRRRPDLIAALDAAALTKAERATLADLGYAVVGGQLKPL
ncbi:MAG TPA: tRNA (guanosine(37)-N1)-methyltransferase TrmD [Micrococcaceae bacterium]|jgi:tRNA (guanine37-N1)-methyltransferase|nr:tRNA (guanosine(37)-N1)-methyltransferase TrmD [Micrococcaceae bacterium]